MFGRKNSHSKIIHIQTAQQKSWVLEGPFEVNQKIPRTRDQRAVVNLSIYFQILNKGMSLRIKVFVINCQISVKVLHITGLLVVSRKGTKVKCIELEVLSSIAAFR